MFFIHELAMEVEVKLSEYRLEVSLHSATWKLDGLQLITLHFIC